MSDVVVSSLQMSGDTLEITYMLTPEGVRDIAGSPVAHLETLILQTTSEAYRDQVTELRQQVEALVADVLEDWSDAQPVQFVDDDEDDDKGMGE